MSIPNVREQEQYLLEMLDPSNPKHVRFVEEFRSKSSPEPLAEEIVTPGIKVYRKKEAEDFVKESKAKATAKENKKTKYVPLYSKVS